MTGGTFNAQGEYYIKTYDDLYLYYNFSNDMITIGDGQGLDFRPARTREPLEEFLIRHLDDGTVYFDIGANNGYYYSLKVAKQCRGCKVYAFEPDPRIFFHLTKNIAINQTDGVKAIQQALSDEEGVAKMTALLGASNFLVQQGTSSPQPTVDVTCTTLDAFVSQNNIQRIDCIKVDIEGGEPNFLKGSRRTLPNLKPILILELNPDLLRRSRSSVEEVKSLLAELDYECIHVKGSADAVGIPRKKMNLITQDDYSWLKKETI